MNSQNQNLVIRVVSALLLLTIALWITWLGGLAFAVLGAVASALAAAELVRMRQPRLEAPEFFGLGVAGLLPLVPWISWHTSGLLAPGWLLAVLAAALVVLCTIHLLRHGPLEQVPTSIAAVVLAWLYCGLLISSAVGLRLRFGFEWVILAFAVTFGNDTLAYFTGRAFGRHPLLPRISPKKTWEGFAGGTAGSLLGALIVNRLFLPSLTLWTGIAIGAGGAVLGPLGDLCESMLKRAAHVKDSGCVIPGHGGLLDRIDAFLFVSPWVYAYAAWLMPR